MSADNRNPAIDTLAITLFETSVDVASPPRSNRSCSHTSTTRSRREEESVAASKPCTKELGKFRSFLCRQAIGIAPNFQAKFEPSDIVQQTLLEAHQKLHQFRGRTDAELAGWLSQMLTHNMADAIRALRRKKRDIARERPLEFRAENSRQFGADWLVADQTTPSLRIRKSEQNAQLLDAIRELPQAQQDVIVLHHLEGRSLAEVAKEMNRTTSAVAGLLYRGLKSLRANLNDG